MRVAAYRKYGNTPLTADGYRFDSIAEARRYAELRILERVGEIEVLRVHPTYELIGAFQDWDGKQHRGIVYEADFAYIEKRRVVVEDVKGGRATRTPVFEIKAKLFMARYTDIELRIVEA